MFKQGGDCMNEYDELQLIKGAKNGNKYCFEQLILAYEKQVYNIAFQYLKNQESAKDVSQEIFIKVYKYINKFNEKSKFSTWLYRIAVNACLDEIRKNKHELNQVTYQIDEDINIASDDLMPEVTVLEKEKKEVIYDSINQLKKEYKTFIILRDIQGFSYKEISDITQTSIGTVKSSLSRARGKLKTLLNDTELFKDNNV